MTIHDDGSVSFHVRGYDFRFSDMPISVNGYMFSPVRINPPGPHPLMDCPKCGQFRGHGHDCDRVLQMEMERNDARRECANLISGIERALMHLDTNYCIDGLPMKDSDAANALRLVSPNTNVSDAPSVATTKTKEANE